MEIKHEDFIGIYDNPWEEDTERLCDELVKWYDICSKNDWTVSDVPMPQNFREDEVMFPFQLSKEGMGSTQGNPLDLMVEQHIDKSLLEIYFIGLRRCLKEYILKYDLNHQNLQHKTNKVHKVLPSQGYHIWHFENSYSETADRILTYSTYLKCPEEGGETEFKYQSKRIKPINGRTLIWPASFTHTHRGNPPLDGEKYYITGWFSLAPSPSRYENTADLKNWNWNDK